MATDRVPAAPGCRAGRRGSPVSPAPTLGWENAAGARNPGKGQGMPCPYGDPGPEGLSARGAD